MTDNSEFNELKYIIYNTKKYKIHTGTKGGNYILINNIKKIY